MVYTKKYEEWHKRKTELNKLSHRNLPTYNVREIWWCSIGVNIGYETDGKNDNYCRPVLVIRKFGATFWGIPVTKKIKDNHYYHRIKYYDKKGEQNVEQCVILSQLRLWDARRLLNYKVKLTSNQFDIIRSELKRIF